MKGIVTVKLWGTTVGYLGYEPGQTELATFEYEKDFLQKKVQLSPLKLKLSELPYSFEDISKKTFHGLPGFIADSLPDKFGDQLINQYFAKQGKLPEDTTALDRLLYIGNRAMGALEYEPSEKITKGSEGIELDINLLGKFAELVVTNKEKFREELQKSNRGDAINLLRIGSIAGGARSKALVAIDKDGKLYDGTVQQNKPCKYYLLKFDSSNNSDRDNKDPKGMTRVEYIYSLIAKECGINIANTDYIEHGEDFHFLIERFDRFFNNDKLEKLHYVSWCGIAHADKDTSGAYSYEQLVLTARELGLGQDTIAEIFRRTVFNIVGRNQDDHTKNFGFLMDKQGKWSLSPAFDMTYSYDPSDKWTSKHQIRLNKKQDGFTEQDIIDFGKLCNVKPKAVKIIILKTVTAFTEFEALAKKYNVKKDLERTVIANLYLKQINDEIIH